MVTPSNSPGPPGWTNGGRDYWGVIPGGSIRVLEDPEGLGGSWRVLEGPEGLGGS